MRSLVNILVVDDRDENLRALEAVLSTRATGSCGRARAARRAATSSII